MIKYDHRIVNHNLSKIPFTSFFQTPVFNNNHQVSPKMPWDLEENPRRDDTGKKNYVPWKKKSRPWKKYLQPLEKKFRLLWPCGPLVIWSSGPLVLWSSGPVVLWSCGSGPVVMWSPGKGMKRNM